jgi:hypothetical protein
MSECHADLRFIAKEMGIVANLKDAMPSGASIPVRTKTAAIGKKITPKGISRQSRPAMSSLSANGIAAAGECVCGATMRFVSVTTHYVALIDSSRNAVHLSYTPSDS